MENLLLTFPRSLPGSVLHNTELELQREKYCMFPRVQCLSFVLDTALTSHLQVSIIKGCSFIIATGLGNNLHKIIFERRR